MTVRPAKTQISLGIRPVWPEFSQCAQWVAEDTMFLHADREDSDQTGRMPRLIWVFAGRRFTLLVLLCRGSFRQIARFKFQNLSTMSYPFRVLWLQCSDILFMTCKEIVIGQDLTTSLLCIFISYITMSVQNDLVNCAFSHLESFILIYFQYTESNSTYIHRNEPTFSGRQVLASTVDPQSSLASVYSVCHSNCIAWTQYSMVTHNKG